jgi:signal peptidase I
VALKPGDVVMFTDGIYIVVKIKNELHYAYFNKGEHLASGNAYSDIAPLQKVVDTGEATLIFNLCDKVKEAYNGR